MTAIRRSPLHEILEPLQPQWVTVHGMAAARHFGDPAGETRQAADLALCDVTCFRRIGIKCSSDLSWLVAQGVPVPAELYGHLETTGPSSLIVRTGTSEVVIEDGFDNDLVVRLSQADLSSAVGVYRIPRQDTGIFLSGERAVKVLAETCGYDFRRPDATLVFTRIAGVSCAVLKRDRPGIPVFHLWCDGSYGGSLWEQLQEVVHESGGRAIGLDALFPAAVR